MTTARTPIFFILLYFFFRFASMVPTLVHNNLKARGLFKCRYVVDIGFPVLGFGTGLLQAVWGVCHTI